MNCSHEMDFSAVSPGVLLVLTQNAGTAFERNGGV
jgi:hypothetical protein